VRLNPDVKRYEDKAGIAKRNVRVPVLLGRGYLLLKSTVCPHPKLDGWVGLSQKAHNRRENTVKKNKKRIRQSHFPIALVTGDCL